MNLGVANFYPQEPEKDWVQDRGYLGGPQNRAHRRILKSCQPSLLWEGLFPRRPVENFLVPHAACPRAVMCQSFRKFACLIFGTRTIPIALFPILADAVDVKRGDQLCEAVSQPSIQPDKVVRPMGS